MIIPAEHANDTMVVLLSRPSAWFRACYYGLVLMLVFIVAWASVSVVELSIHAQGMIRPSQGVHSYSSLFSTFVESVYVSENQRITKGDTLISFHTDDLRVQLAMTRMEIETLSHEIADLKTLARLPSAGMSLSLPEYRSEYDALRRQFLLAEIDVSSSAVKFRRVCELRKKALISEAEYEEAQSSYDLATMKLEELRHAAVSRFEREASQKEASVRALMKQESVLRDQQTQRYITANADGFVYVLAVKKGGVPVQAGQELCSVTPSTELSMEFFVPAKDVGFITEALPVRYEIHAFPFQEWGMAEGRIVMIASDVLTDPQSGESMFKVVGTLSSSSLMSHRSGFRATIKKGMTFTAHARVAEKRLIDMLLDRVIPYDIFRESLKIR